jgi:hypothetical protein
MNCKNCNNQINNDVKFCGKCGNKIEEEKTPQATAEMDTNAHLDQEKLIKEVKSVGNFFNIFGYIKVIFGVVIIFLLASNSDALEFISLGYSDAAFTIIIGVLWIILGGRIAKNIDKSTRKYLLIIFWLLIILGIAGFLLNIAAGGSGSGGLVVSILFAVYANKGLKKFKLINIKN